MKRVDLVDNTYGISARCDKRFTVTVSGVSISGTTAATQHVWDRNDNPGLAAIKVIRPASEPYNPKLVEYAKRYKFEPPYYKELEAWEEEQEKEKQRTAHRFQ